MRHGSSVQQQVFPPAAAGASNVSYGTDDRDPDLTAKQINRNDRELQGGPYKSAPLLLLSKLCYNVCQ